MKFKLHFSASNPGNVLLGIVLALGLSATAFAQQNRYQSLTANLSGVRIHYLKAAPA
jgi:hypothetical protein